MSNNEFGYNLAQSFPLFLLILPALEGAENQVGFFVVLVFFFLL